MKSTAIANANIALVKYWGKRDKKLILPYNSSISMTCDGLWTKTTVEYGDYAEDTIIVNNSALKKDEKDVLGHLRRIKELGEIKENAKVVSESNFPVAAGLASSASGLAALTLAATSAAKMNLDNRQLSILARKGSGSASRSIDGGFVEWVCGSATNGEDSHAVQLAKPTHWKEFRMIACIVSEIQKKTSSRAGMSQTVSTSPYYAGWLKSVENDLDEMRNGIKYKDFTQVGRVAERNALKMHATMMTTMPSIIYWQPATVEIMHFIMQLREEGMEAYFTMDAGPQVKVLCLEENEEELNKRLLDLNGVKKTIVCKPGDAAHTTKEHLF